ncbi:MAG: hypothetical protein V1897_03445 [Pseudomonadota bacterium]
MVIITTITIMMTMTRTTMMTTTIAMMGIIGNFDDVKFGKPEV